MTRRRAASLPIVVALVAGLSLGACSSGVEDAEVSVPPVPSSTTTTAAASTETTVASDAPCRTTGTVTGDEERTWTGVPTEVVAVDGAAARYVMDDDGTTLEVDAAGDATPAAARLLVVGEAEEGTATYAVADLGETDIAADGSGASVDTNLAGQGEVDDEELHLTVVITCA